MNKLRTVDLRPNPKRRRRRLKKKSSAKLITKKAAAGRRRHVVELIFKKGRGLDFCFLGKSSRRVSSKTGARQFETDKAARAAAQKWVRKNENLSNLVGARVLSV